MERFALPEVLFQPNDFWSKTLPKLEGVKGIHELAFDAVAACDPDMRPLLLNHVVLCGGTTLLPGFTDRVNSELSAMFPNVSHVLY